ncbi:MAG: diacylglycerol kinase family lipid kinase [Betaproteobacteria bacterium]|nr:diacylglycerol kinase family lipid kinase [Betaproteobacteria bacterium]
MKRHLVILNPAAGRGRVRREWPRLAQALRSAGVSFDVIETRAPGEGVGFAERAAREYDAVIAAGGDGTVHEVANGLLRAGEGAAFGVLPLGSGDDFVKMLPARDAVERVSHAEPRAFDAGRIRVGDEVRYFANGMDIGFGAHASRNVRRVPGFLTGLGAYLGALALTLVRYPKLEVRLQLDGGAPFAQTTAMTAVMNGRAFGGSFHVCPGACADDGELDLLIADGVGRLAILGLVPRIMCGTHGSDPRLKLRRARSVLIESDAPLLVEADGEIAFEDAHRLEIEILPGALRVLC